MKPVFADTVYYLAVTNPRDQYRRARGGVYGGVLRGVRDHGVGDDRGGKLADSRSRPRAVS